MNTNQNIIADFVDFDSEGSIEAFLDFVDEGELLGSIDLLAANPDVAEQVRDGTYDVNLLKIAPSTAVYVVVIDDGRPGALSEEWIRDCYFVTGSLEDAKKVRDEAIMDWKRNWGLVL